MAQMKSGTRHVCNKCFTTSNTSGSWECVRLSCKKMNRQLVLIQIVEHTFSAIFEFNVEKELFVRTYQLLNCTKASIFCFPQVCVI